MNFKVSISRFCAKTQEAISREEVAKNWRRESNIIKNALKQSIV